MSRHPPFALNANHPNTDLLPADRIANGPGNSYSTSFSSAGRFGQSTKKPPFGGYCARDGAGLAARLLKVFLDHHS